MAEANQVAALKLPSLVFFMLLGVFAFVLPRALQSSGNAAIPSGQSLGITIGLQQPPTFNYGTELNAVNALAGKNHGVVLYYVDWSTAFNPFLQNQINSQMAAGDRPIIMLAWGPARGQLSLGCDQNYTGAVPWDNITQGLCDTYITNYANAMKARPERFLLKFAHEMNGGAQSYSPQFVGINPSGFVAAWQHVRTIFATQSVTNVEWVWAPIYQSYPNTAANDLHLYYPGDSYVDWVGPMGYNYYTQLQGAPQPWMTFDDIFGATLRDFSCRYAKPQIIHEFASVEGDTNSPSKATWISDAYLKAQNYPFLRTIVWYNDTDVANSADFRITTSTQSQNPATPTNVNPLPPGTNAWTNAYNNAIASSAYTSTFPSKSAATPSNAACIYLPIIIK